MPTGFCKYHRQEELLCKAHILPNAFYKHLRRSGADGFWLNEVGSTKTKGIPGGLYDRNMLCSEADNELGRYDKYGISVFKEERPGTIFMDRNGRELARIENLDIAAMNLFLLSYIWRCHHAQIEPFKTFNIGAIYEERIRQKLIARNGEAVHWFSYMLTMMYGSIEDAILPIKFPFKRKIEGFNFVFLYFFNFKVIAKLDAKTNIGWLNAVAATPGKPVVVPAQAYHKSGEFEIEQQSVIDLVKSGARW